MSDVGVDGTTSEGDDRTFGEVSKGYTQFRNEDILVAKITPCFENGKIAQAKIRHMLGAGSTEFHVIRPDSDRVDVRYLLRFLRQPDIRAAGEHRMTGTGGQRRVPEAYLADLQVPLPPLEEQRRTAQLLDHLDKLRASRRQTLRLLDALDQSIFLEMFGSPRSEINGGATTRLGEVVELYGGASLPAGVPFADQEEGYLLLKVSDMNLPGNERWISRSHKWSERPGPRSATCPAGTVIVPKRGAAIATNKKRVTTRPSVLDPNLMGLRPDPEHLTQDYFYHWLLAFDLSSITSGSTVPQLNKQDLKPLLLPVPPLTAQEEFSRRIARTEGIRNAQSCHLAHLSILFATVEHQAFHGDPPLTTAA